MTASKKVRSVKSGAVSNAATNRTRSAVPRRRQSATKSSSASVHPDLEPKLAAFTSFWYLAVRYQILKGMSDTRLANVLNVSDHTVRKWRSCVVASAVVQELIDLVPRVPDSIRSVNTEKVLKSLCDRRKALLMPATRSGRKGANLPTLESFAAAVAYSKDEILVDFVRGLDPTASSSARQGAPSARTLAIANSISTDLVQLYQYADTLDIAEHREELANRVARIGQLSSRIALNKTLGYFSHLEAESGALAAELLAAVEEAQREARAYVGKLYSKMKASDIFSEKSSFLDRFLRGELPFSGTDERHPDDPFEESNLEKARAADVAKLEALIASVARVRLPASKRKLSKR